MTPQEMIQHGLLQSPATVYALVTPMDWDGGGNTVSLHWTEEGAFLEKCRREELPGINPDHYKELSIVPMDIID